MDNEISMAGPWVTDDDMEIVIDTLRSGWYGKDAYTYVETFEFEFAKYHNRRFGLMTPNCGGNSASNSAFLAVRAP